jgi:hypothetical protein
MGYTGGDTIEMTYNHPTLGSGSFFFKANEDGSVDQGGVRTNDDANGITGNGVSIRQMNRARASFEASVVWDMIDQDELSRFNALAGDPNDADWTITNISGAIWGGKGFPVGDLVGNTNTAMIPVKIAFDKLERLN